MVHELLHALGLMHEHQRFFAEHFIEYLWDESEEPEFVIDDFSFFCMWEIMSF